MTREEYINILEIDKAELAKENQELKKQVEYLRSGEYLNQLKFERDILQDVVDNGGVSKEDKEFIDCTHRNTELLEENEKLKKQLSSKTLELEKDKTGYIRSLNNQLSENIEPDPEDFYLAEIEEKANNYDKLLIQQKEFIKWLENGIEKVKNTEFLDERIQRAGLIAYNRCLQKYKEITGTTNE